MIWLQDGGIYSSPKSNRVGVLLCLNIALFAGRKENLLGYKVLLKHPEVFLFRIRQITCQEQAVFDLTFGTSKILSLFVLNVLIF